MGLEIRNDMPDEVKNQTVDGKKKVVTEKIPDKYLKEISDLNNKKQQLTFGYLQLAMQIDNSIKEKMKILDKVKNITKDSLPNRIQNAFKKMKLGKRKDYRWKFKRDSFVGVLVEPKKKPEPPKK